MAAHDTGQKMDDLIRTWTMVVLTLIFVGLYIAALAGWPGGLNAGQLERLTRIEQIVFVIIGYYFGRLPGQQNEKTLKEEVNRQAQKADQAQDEKEQAQRSSDTLQEKVKNVKAALATTVPGPPTLIFP